MKDPRVTRRYATALYDIAVKRGVVARVAEDVQVLAESYRAVPQLGQLMESPQVPLDRKKAVLKELFGSQIQPLTLQFLQLLVDKQRIDTLENLLEEFQRLSDATSGIVRARVQTAIPLTPEQESRLTQQLATLTGKSVVLRASVDPAIKGGAVVWIGDRVIDGSVTGYLADMERRLAAPRPMSIDTGAMSRNGARAEMGSQGVTEL